MRARRAAVVAVLGAVAVGVATAPGLDSVRTALADGSAWLARGTDMAHASSSTGEADWLVSDVVEEEGAGQARVAQDGDLTLVVDPAGGQSFSIDAVTLEAGDPIEAGIRRDDACSPIEAAGLTCNLVPVPSPNPVHPEGVYDQNPDPGARVGPGSTVIVTYDNRAWATLYQFDNPANYQLSLSTSSSGPAGWNRTQLGRIFLEQAPGTVPIYCFEPNGAGSNESNQYYPDPALPSSNFRPCASPILGYGVVPTAMTLDQVIIYSFSWFSERYYSQDPNDPVGVAEYSGRPEGSQDSGVWLIWN
jgi:hypothetical protein